MMLGDSPRIGVVARGCRRRSKPKRVKGRNIAAYVGSADVFPEAVSFHQEQNVRAVG